MGATLRRSYSILICCRSYELRMGRVGVILLGIYREGRRIEVEGWETKELACRRGIERMNAIDVMRSFIDVAES